MQGASDGNSSVSMDWLEDDNDQTSGRKRKFNQQELWESIQMLSDDQIREIIGTAKKGNRDNKTNKNTPLQKIPQNIENHTTSTPSTSRQHERMNHQNTQKNSTNKHKNYSNIMKEITNK